jgi:hypothetical protein
MIMLVADLVTLYWVGMWLGLIARNHHQAASRSLAWVLVLPWLAFALVLLAVALSFIDRQNPDLSWNFFFGWWFGLGLAIDLWVTLWSRNKLLTEFRVAAERRYEGRPSLLSRLVGKRE